MIKGVIKYIGYAFPIFLLPENMSQFQYCLSIDPDHHKCESNLHWIVMQMYKLKTEVQNNHGINFRLVGIMQAGWWSKNEAHWQIVWFCQQQLVGDQLLKWYGGRREVQAKSSK